MQVGCGWQGVREVVGRGLQVAKETGGGRDCWEGVGMLQVGVQIWEETSGQGCSSHTQKFRTVAGLSLHLSAINARMQDATRQNASYK